MKCELLDIKAESSGICISKNNSSLKPGVCECVENLQMLICIEKLILNVWLMIYKYYLELNKQNIILLSCNKKNLEKDMNQILNKILREQSCIM